LGDLGMGVAVAILIGSLLGRGEETELRKQLAAARTMFLLLAGVMLVVFIVLSPWMPGWLGFKEGSGAGSLTLLFITGGMSTAIFVLAGYFHSLNYAHGTVWWPMLPTLLLGQMFAPLLHWLCARAGWPLWIQIMPYLGTNLLIGWFVWRMLKWSHPSLGDLRPLSWDRRIWKTLAAASGWAYLWNLGSTIYFVAARLVINAWIGPATVTTYQFNYKICELSVSLILAASFVSQPKIMQWLASGDPANHQRVVTEVNRLNVFQIICACAAALGYLAINDLFIRLWLGPGYHAPLAWQAAFACNLAVTCSGDAGIQLAARSAKTGMKIAGLFVGGTGLLNLALCILAAQRGSTTGVAVATVIAQSVLTVGLGIVACRNLGMSSARWVAKSWLLPLAATVAAAGLKSRLPDESFAHIGSLIGIYAVLLLIVCAVAGMNAEMLRAEISLVRSLFRPK
jgi:O-antigen/teichoic acid export membrane protein